MSARRTTLIAAALLLALVFACRKPGEKVNSGAAGTTDTSATATSGTDTSGTTTTSTAASATTTGSTGGTVSNLSDADKEFVTKAAQGGLAEVQLGLAAELQGKSGKDFDKDYMKSMVSDHEKDVMEFEKESKNAQDADLKNWASKTLPTLQEHLRIAKETQKKVK